MINSCLALLGTLLLFGGDAAFSNAGAMETIFVRGYAGGATGGFKTRTPTHLGDVAVQGVRQVAPNLTVRWLSAPLPAKLGAQKVTFVWTGAVGGGGLGGGDFTLYLNGRAVADLGSIRQPTRFPVREAGCELLYNPKWVHAKLVESSGHFYLTVPASWLRPGEPARLEVRGRDTGEGYWFALVAAEDAPLGLPSAAWSDFIRRNQPALPPPPGTEATYAWYLGQFGEPCLYSPVGPPADPAESAISHTGQIFGNPELSMKDVPHTAPRLFWNGLIFTLYDGHQLVHVGDGEPARQSLVGGNLPIVVTTWKNGDLEWRETAFGEPLRGEGYQSGTEPTLVWAAIELTNHGREARAVTLPAYDVGDRSHPKPNLLFQDGVVMQGQSARLAVQAPEGFKAEFNPIFPAQAQLSSTTDTLLNLSTHAGGFNAVVVSGTLGAGATARIVFNRVFEHPDVEWRKTAPHAPVAPQELTRRSYQESYDKAVARWQALAKNVWRFTTPDPVVNNIARKAMLDGYYLTKRWDGRSIVFDSVVYRCQWDDSSRKWTNALDLMGDHETSAKLIETTLERQGIRKPTGTRTHEGCLSDATNTVHDGSSASWASCNGWGLWSMAEHARLTGDREWLKKNQARILAACQWIVRERAFSREKPGNPCAGLLYGKFVCDLPEEGEVSGIGYFTYTDAINYMGLHEMAVLLAEWGYPESGPLLKEAEAYQRDIVAAVDRLTDKSRDPWYIPWMLHAPKYENRYFYDAVGPINLAYARVVPVEDERITQVIRWIVDHVHRGSLEETTMGLRTGPGEGWNYGGGSTFYIQDLAVTLLERGQVEDFLRIFYAILAGDISHETLTTCEWGPGAHPHVHSISSLIRMLRTMMIQERDGRLYLLQGIPRRWLAEGQKIEIDRAPTWYGPLSLRSSSERNTVEMQLTVPERIGPTPIYLRLRLPEGQRIESFKVNGHAQAALEGDTLVLRGLAGKKKLDIRLHVSDRGKRS